MMKKSFTLIELIVVIAIIAILAAIIAPNAFRAIEKAKIVKTASDLKTIKAAILIYRTDTGAWPCPGVPGDCSANYIEDSNHCLLTNPGIAGWDGPYLESIPTSSLAKAPAIPSCGKYGIYFSAWAKCCATGSCPNYSRFDFSGDGDCRNNLSDCDTVEGVSVSVYGFPSEKIILAVDAVFDGVGLNDYKGIMNVVWPGCTIVALYVGEPQP